MNYLWSSLFCRLAVLIHNIDLNRDVTKKILMPVICKVSYKKCKAIFQQMSLSLVSAHIKTHVWVIFKCCVLHHCYQSFFSDDAITEINSCIYDCLQLSIHHWGRLSSCLNLRTLNLRASVCSFFFFLTHPAWNTFKNRAEMKVFSGMNVWQI